MEIKVGVKEVGRVTKILEVKTGIVEIDLEKNVAAQRRKGSKHHPLQIKVTTQYSGVAEGMK